MVMAIYGAAKTEESADETSPIAAAPVSVVNPSGAARGNPSPKPARTILPMEVSPPSSPPIRFRFDGAGTPQTIYRPFPFYHLGHYSSPFRNRLFH